MNSGRHGEFEWASATHDGYQASGVSRIERCIAIGSSRTWVCCDLAAGQSHDELLGYLHFGIGVSVEQIDTNDSRIEFLIQDEQTKRGLQFFGTMQAQLHDGWYCPAFGFREKNRVIEYQLNSINSVGGWVLSEVDAQLAIECSGKDFTLKNASDDTTFEWHSGR